MSRLRLNSDVLSVMLGFCDVEEIFQLRATCRTYHDLLCDGSSELSKLCERFPRYQPPPTLETLIDLSGTSGIAPKDRSLVSRCSCGFYCVVERVRVAPGGALELTIDEHGDNSMDGIQDPISSECVVELACLEKRLVSLTPITTAFTVHDLRSWVRGTLSYALPLELQHGGRSFTYGVSGYESVRILKFGGHLWDFWSPPSRAFSGGPRGFEPFRVLFEDFESAAGPRSP